MTPLVLSLMFVTTAAIVLLVLGLRGRRVDDHPLCRRCGFDLVGKPAASTACGECGADLGRRRAIRVGNRLRRRRAVASGTALLVPALGVGGYVGWRELRAVDWQKHKPVWMLAREAVSRDPKTLDAALAELLDRQAKGNLSPAQIDSLTNRGLDYQADLARGWTQDWGAFLERALAGLPMSDPRKGRYAAQGMAFELRIPPQVRPGDGAWVRVLAQPRLGAGARFQLRVTRSFRLGASQEFHVVPLVVRDYTAATRGPADWSTPMNPAALYGLRPGPQTAQLKVELEVFATSADARAGRHAHRARRELVTQWELLPADSPVPGPER